MGYLEFAVVIPFLRPMYVCVLSQKFQNQLKQIYQCRFSVFFIYIFIPAQLFRHTLTCAPILC